ncbi:right-handed parallel beta-helix repeat-containing protein [Alienimonas sp. DA493]|uniref:right-handed parallel beta-helix repeat-containing protein n=1 Tax=Alienimonas sp. DA493 TaxID=3373605 RepID=UPI003755052D
MRIERLPSRLVLTLAAAAMFWASVPAEGANIYVRTNGNDGPADPSAWGKSPDKAWRSVSKAAGAAVAGDTIYVGAGTYDGYAPQYNDGTSTAPIRYVADTDGSHTGDAGTVTIRPGSTYSGADGYWLGLGIFGDHTIVDGFTFERNNPSDTRTSYPAAAAYCTGVRYQNCRFRNCTGGFGALSGAGVAIVNCVFEGCVELGLGVRSATATAVTGCTFTDNTVGLIGESSALTVTNCTFTRTGTTGTHVRLDNSAATLTNCTLTGGAYGVYQSSGASATVRGCVVAGIQTVGLWLGSQATEIDDCDISGSATGAYLPATGGAEPIVRDSVIRDCGVGLSVAWTGLTLRLTTLSGHSDAGLRIASSVSSFHLGALDTVTIAGCRYGLAWNGDAGVPQALTVDSKTWSGNEDHIYTADVENVVVRNLSASGGHGGLQIFAADSLAVSNCAFADDDGTGAWETRAAILAEAASVVVTDCSSERWYYGLHLTGANDPDVQRVTIRDCGRDAVRLDGGSWNWQAADAVALHDNWIGVYALNAALNVDGGAAGIDVDGAAGTGHGLYAVGGTTTCRNVHVADSALGFHADRSRGVLLENCSANGCGSQAVQIVRDTADPAAVAATVTNFAATDCGNGVAYSRGAGTADGVGQIVLQNVSLARAVTPDGNGYAVNPTGTGLTLADCPLDPAFHAGLTISGYETGLFVASADLAIEASTALNVSSCGTALVGTDGAATLADWNCSGNWYSFRHYPAGATTMLSGCDLVGRDGAIYVEAGGDFTAAGCTFASEIGDAVAAVSFADADFAFTDCTVAASGEDAFQVEAASAALGTGAATFTRCLVAAADDDGFQTRYVDVVMRDCVVAGCGDTAASLREGAADLADCAVASAGGRGISLTGSSTVRVARCRIENCGAEALWLSGVGGAATIENLLAVASPDGVVVHNGAATAALRHLTITATNRALRIDNSAVALANGILVGAVGAAATNGGSATLDHVLLFAATPYSGVAPGPDDLLEPPRFRDAPAGDYRLGEGSPAINVGRDLAGVVDADLLGAARPSYRRYDLGAYEYHEADGSLRILDWREAAN